MWGLAAALLLAPALAMRCTPEVMWGPGDFLAFALLLFAVCAGMEGAMRLRARPFTRRAFALAVPGIGLLVWAELAVGIVGPG
jgi:hypothetical protein